MRVVVLMLLSTLLPAAMVTTEPRLISRVEPAYTAEARDAGVTGTMRVFIRIDAQGRPGNLRVINRLGYGLEDQAVAAIRQWRFAPGTRNGHPVATEATVEIEFRVAFLDCPCQFESADPRV